MRKFTIRVPCSSANIGPGFDVIGIALSIWLELDVEVDGSAAASAGAPLNCHIDYSSPLGGDVPRNADENLITRTALYVLRCHGQRAFPAQTRVHIKNAIPLGRGLGSSGAAVVAGVVLGSEVGGLRLSKARMLDYSLMIERHPDNVAAALYGGFVGTYLNELSPADTERKEIPLSEVLPAPAGGVDTGLTPPEPPVNIGHYEQFAIAPELHFIAVIPRFELKTADARAALQSAYARSDVVFNLQRIPLLLRALARSPPVADTIHQAMQDKIHQPYRAALVPGLQQILSTLTPRAERGLCGICLSGAGPTILALATERFDEIAARILAIFRAHGVECDWQLLKEAEDGAHVVERE